MHTARVEVRQTYGGDSDKVETERISGEEGGDEVNERWMLFISPCLAHHTDTCNAYGKKFAISGEFQVKHSTSKFPFYLDATFFFYL